MYAAFFTAYWLGIFGGEVVSIFVILARSYFVAQASLKRTVILITQRPEDRIPDMYPHACSAGVLLGRTELRVLQCCPRDALKRKRPAVDESKTLHLKV